MPFRSVPNLIVALLAWVAGYSFPAASANSEKDLSSCESGLQGSQSEVRFAAQVEAPSSDDVPIYAGRVRIMPSVAGGDATVQGEPSFLFSVNDGRQYIAWAGKVSESSGMRKLFISRLLGMEPPVFAYALEPDERIFGFSFLPDLRKMRVFTSRRTLVVEYQ